jgi:O-antigen/teichoic acid export membrane protein
MDEASSEAAGPVPASLAASVADGRTLASARRFLGRFGLATLWQVLGKLVGVVGLSYAYRCLGPENVGVSGTVLVTAMFAQLVLDFGLDIVSVRHAAGRTIPLPQLVQAIFSLRLLLAIGGLLVFTAAAVLVPGNAAERWVWWFGGLHLTFLNLNFCWYFQATERMPRFSLIQNATTVATTVLFLVAFRPGQRVGSDLVVTMVLNALTTVGVWAWIRRRQGQRLFDRRSLPLALRLFREARPTWVFNLTYCALGALSLPLCKYFLGDREAGYFRSAAMLVGALQVVLSYFAFMLNPRIVQWRAGPAGRLHGRLLLLTGVLVAGSVVCLAGFWLVRRPLILLLWGEPFLPAADVLPVLISAKFLALASGLLVWGLFANYREWLAVACCLPVLAVAAVANVLLIPQYGLTAAAWLNFGAEFGLLVLCFWALNRVERQRARAR